VRHITLLLIVMATALLAASGVAWAVTKTCPPDPKVCVGTNGADVLKSSSKDNNMLGKGGNDTYTHFVRGNVGKDVIKDTRGSDKLLLTNYSQSEVKARRLDTNKNNKADSVVLYLGQDGKHWVGISGFYDDTRSKPPFRRGPGYIEVIRTKGSSSGPSNPSNPSKNTITGDYVGTRTIVGASPPTSRECYSFYSDRTVELRHNGLPTVNETGIYKGDASSGEIVWNSGKVPSSVVAQGDGSLKIDGLTVTRIVSCLSPP
jgi:hypothetical protein